MSHPVASMRNADRETCVCPHGTWKQLQGEDDWSGETGLQDEQSVDENGTKVAEGIRTREMNDGEVTEQ